MAVCIFNKNYKLVSCPGKCYLGFSPDLSCFHYFMSPGDADREKLLFLLQHFLKNSKARKE